MISEVEYNGNEIVQSNSFTEQELQLFKLNSGQLGVLKVNVQNLPDPANQFIKQQKNKVSFQQMFQSNMYNEQFEKEEIQNQIMKEMNEHNLLIQVKSQLDKLQQENQKILKVNQILDQENKQLKENEDMNYKRIEYLQNEIKKLKEQITELKLNSKQQNIQEQTLHSIPQQKLQESIKPPLQSKPPQIKEQKQESIDKFHYEEQQQAFDMKSMLPQQEQNLASSNKQPMDQSKQRTSDIKTMELQPIKMIENINMPTKLQASRQPERSGYKNSKIFEPLKFAHNGLQQSQYQVLDNNLFNNQPEKNNQGIPLSNLLQAVANQSQNNQNSYYAEQVNTEIIPIKKQTQQYQQHSQDPLPINILQPSSIKKSRFHEDLSSFQNASYYSPAKSNAEVQQNLIFPFAEPMDYFLSTQRVKNYGRVIEYEQEYEQFFDIVKLGNQFHNILNFKISCLLDQGIIYENELLELSMDYMLYPHEFKEYLRLNLFLQNLAFLPIDTLQLSYSGNQALQLWSKPSEFSAGIAPQEGVKQELIIDINDIPYPLMSLDIYCETQQNSKQFELYIPMTLNKFMRFQDLTKEEFKTLWKEKKSFLDENYDNLIASGYIITNENMMKTAHDIKKYFNKLVDLNPEAEYDYISGCKSLKFGGIFSFGAEKNASGMEQKHLIKFSVTPTQQLIIQIFYDIVTGDASESMRFEFLLSTLIFLFSQ